MPITYRAAVPADQPVIAEMIRQARLNPRNLHWERFLVAEDAGRIVGIRQVKQHPGGTREVGSGYVAPAYRRQGISAELMRRLLEREPGRVYLMCNSPRSGYYEQFGFRRVPARELPSDFLKEYRIGRLVTGALSLFRKEKLSIVPMMRETPPPG